MAGLVWCRLIEATRVARRSANQLYRLAALGVITTRRDERARLEFLVSDLERVAKEVPTAEEER